MKRTAVFLVFVLFVIFLGISWIVVGNLVAKAPDDERYEYTQGHVYSWSQSAGQLIGHYCFECQIVCQNQGCLDRLEKAEAK